MMVSKIKFEKGPQGGAPIDLSKTGVFCSSSKTGGVNHLIVERIRHWIVNTMKS